MMNTATDHIAVAWDGDHRFLGTVDQLRKEYGGTNLFDDDGFEWYGAWGESAADLDEVLGKIQPGDEWNCGNCTVSLAPSSPAEGA